MSNEVLRARLDAVRLDIAALRQNSAFKLYASASGFGGTINRIESLLVALVDEVQSLKESKQCPKS